MLGSASCRRLGAVAASVLESFEVPFAVVVSGEDSGGLNRVLTTADTRVLGNWVSCAFVTPRTAARARERDCQARFVLLLLEGAGLYDDGVEGDGIMGGKDALSSDELSYLIVGRWVCTCARRDCGQRKEK